MRFDYIYLFTVIYLACGRYDMHTFMMKLCSDFQSAKMENIKVENDLIFFLEKEAGSWQRGLMR